VLPIGTGNQFILATVLVLLELLSHKNFLWVTLAGKIGRLQRIFEKVK
jgi:hypothetical protein